MDNFGSEIGQKMRSAVKAKLLELGTGGSAGYIDDELPDYVMIMVANKRSKQQMVTDLNLFLGTQTELFVTWLHEVLQKLQEVTLPAVSATAPKKRKASTRDEPTTAASSSTSSHNKKDRKTLKKDKKSVPAKKTDQTETTEENQTPTTTTDINPSIPVISSLTDVFAEDLLEKAKKTLDLNADAVASIKKGKAKKSSTIESLPPPSTTTTTTEATKRSNTSTTSDFDIPTISEISSTTGTGGTSGDREKDLAELAEIQKKIYAAKKHLKNLENFDDAESEDEDFLNLKDDGSAEEFNEAGDLVKKKVTKSKSPIVFDHNETNSSASIEKLKEYAQSKHQHITQPPKVQKQAAGPIITASSIDNKPAVSPHNRIRQNDFQPRQSRERERREPPATQQKRSVHERLGSKPQQPLNQQKQHQREENIRERRSRQEKELYVPAFRRREIESERKREQDKGVRDGRDRDRERERERGRDRSLIRRRSSPEQQPVLSSSSAPNTNASQRSQVVQIVNVAAERKKRSDSGPAVVTGIEVTASKDETRVQRQRIGSRVIVATSKPPESSDDDLLAKPVNSVIKIKPRPPVSPAKQACKNLLLRAVAEAQRSTILKQTKSTEKAAKITLRLGKIGVVNDRSTKLYTKSYRDRLKRSSGATSSSLYSSRRENLVIEVEGEGRRDHSGHRPNSENEMEENESGSEMWDSDNVYEYVAQNESGNEEDIEIDYHVNANEYEEHSSSNELDTENTQFVVTLNDKQPLPRYKRAHNVRSRSHSPPPLVTSSSSTSRNTGMEPSSTTRRSREPRRGDIKSRLQLKANSSVSPSTNVHHGERESTNSSQSCNTPPPPRRSELIEIYRKPKEIKKIIIKNDSEDDDSPVKMAKHDKPDRSSKSAHKRRSHDEPTIERSLTPPMPPKKKRSSASSAETKLITTTVSPKRSKSPAQRKRTPIKFDVETVTRSVDNEHNNANVGKLRSRSYERGTSVERRSDEYQNSRRKISIRNSEAKKYDNIPSLSSIAIDSTVIKVGKKKELCKYHPICKKHNCDYYHPTALCNSFPNCKYADKCNYSHPNCKFDMACTNAECNYAHSGIRNPNQLQTQAPPLSSHVVPVQNYKSISAAPAASSAMCKYYPNCSKLGCTFYHPKPCRFGKNCINKLECSFYHHEIQSSSKFKWVASAV